MNSPKNIPDALAALIQKAERNISTLFDKLTRDPKQGTIFVEKERYLLIRAASLATDFFDCIVSLYGDKEKETAEQIARQLLYDLAHAIGKKDAQHFSKNHKKPDTLENFVYGPVHFAYTGWANVKILPDSILTPDPNYLLLVEHPHSFEADAWLHQKRNAHYPVCIMSAGYSSGWCSTVFNLSLSTTEILCRAKGDDCCRFVMCPPEQMQQHIEIQLLKLPKKIQKHLAYHIPTFFKSKAKEEAQSTATASLKAIEEKFNAITDSGLDAIIFMDNNGNISFWNNAAFDMLGYTQEEVLGKNLHQTLAPIKYEPEYKKGLRHFFKTGHGNVIGKIVELEAIRKDCKIIPVELSLSAMKINDNWHALGIMRDISYRKSVEAELKLSKAVLENTVEGVLITNAKNQIIDVNPALVKLSGYSKEELMGKNPSILSSGRHDRPFYLGMWHDLLTLGHWTGEIWNRRKSGEIYPESISISTIRSNSGEVLNYMSVSEDITRRKEKEHEINYRANHDMLTGLLNRRSFFSLLTQSINLSKRNHCKLAVFFMDLDRFKPVNDTYGHLVGDELLKDVAKRLRYHVRESDCVARFGGDEFAIFLYDVNDAEYVKKVAQNIVVDLVKPIHLKNVIANISISIGIAIYPDDSIDIDELIKQADTAMYHVKETSRNNFALWSDLKKR